MLSQSEGEFGELIFVLDHHDFGVGLVGRPPARPVLQVPARVPARCAAAAASGSCGGSSSSI